MRLEFFTATAGDFEVAYNWLSENYKVTNSEKLDHGFVIELSDNGEIHQEQLIDRLYEILEEANDDHDILIEIGD